MLCDVRSRQEIVGTLRKHERVAGPPSASEEAGPGWGKKTNKQTKHVDNPRLHPQRASVPPFLPLLLLFLSAIAEGIIDEQKRFPLYKVGSKKETWSLPLRSFTPPGGTRAHAVCPW